MHTNKLKQTPVDIVMNTTGHAAVQAIHLNFVMYLVIVRTEKTDWIGMSSVLPPHQHSIRYMGDSFYRSNDPSNSIKVLKEHRREQRQRYNMMCQYRHRC